MADTNQNTGMNDTTRGTDGRNQSGSDQSTGRESSGEMGQKGGQARWDSDTPTGNTANETDMDTDTGSM